MDAIVVGIVVENVVGIVVDIVVNMVDGIVVCTVVCRVDVSIGVVIVVVSVWEDVVDVLSNSSVVVIIVDSMVDWVVGSVVVSPDRPMIGISVLSVSVVEVNSVVSVIVDVSAVEDGMVVVSMACGVVVTVESLVVENPSSIVISARIVVVGSVFGTSEEFGTSSVVVAMISIEAVPTDVSTVLAPSPVNVVVIDSIVDASGVLDAHEETSSVDIYA